MFDTRSVERNRKKSKKILYQSPFHKFMCEDLLNRLEPIDRTFNNILLINPLIDNILVQGLNTKYPHHKLIIIESTEQIKLIKHKLDLIIFPFGLQWILDPQKFLKQIYEILEPSGLFIGNFPGGGTLSNLRRKLIELELQNTKVHVPHISPFIQFEHMNPLLGQAGFIENIIDMESIELEYENALSLMKAIKMAGEGNSLKNGVFYSITHNMHNELKITHDRPFIDHINLISFISSKSRQSIKLLREHFSPIEIKT